MSSHWAYSDLVRASFCHGFFKFICTRPWTRFLLISELLERIACSGQVPFLSTSILNGLLTCASAPQRQQLNFNHNELGRLSRALWTQLSAAESMGSLAPDYFYLNSLFPSQFSSSIFLPSTVSHSLLSGASILSLVTGSR